MLCRWDGDLGKAKLWRGLYKISSGTCNNSHSWHLPLSWLMVQSLPGAVNTMVVTAPLFNISSRTCSKFKPHLFGICHLGSWISELLGQSSYPGGDSSAVQDQRRHMCGKFRPQRLRLLRFLSRWICCDLGHGGDSSAVQDQLQNVQYVVSTYAAFAAVLADGSVVTWGFADSGGFPVLQFKISSDAQAFFQWKATRVERWFGLRIHWIVPKMVVFLDCSWFSIG